MRKCRNIGIVLILVLVMLSFASCKGNMDRMEFTSMLTEEERVYYTGQEFDIAVTTDRGTFSKIPNVYIVYSDGSRSEDVSHSDKITFSGYDPDTEGKQTITVIYREGANTVKAYYGITVRLRELAYMEADDTYHYINPFKVGDRFTVSEMVGEVKRGVTVTFRYNDPENPCEAFFADDPALEGIEFDTTGCLLDKEGRFTQEGIFTVVVSYRGMTATYKISVAKAEESK